MRLFGSAPASAQPFALGGLEEVMSGAEMCSTTSTRWQVRKYAVPGPDQPGSINIGTVFAGIISAKHGLTDL